MWRRVHKNVNKNKNTYRVRRDNATRKMVQFHKSVTNLMERPVLQRTLTPGHSLSSMYQSFEDSLSLSSSVHSSQQEQDEISVSVENKNNNNNTLNRNHVQFVGMNENDIQKYTLFQRQLTPRPDSFFYSMENWNSAVIDEEERATENDGTHSMMSDLDDLEEEEDALLDEEKREKEGNFKNHVNLNHHVHFNSKTSSFNIACLPRPPMNTGDNIRYFSSTPTPRPNNTMENRVKLPLLTISSSLSSTYNGSGGHNDEEESKLFKNNATSMANNHNKINRQLTPRVQIVDIFGNTSNFSTYNNNSNTVSDNAEERSNLSQEIMKNVTLAIPVNYAYKGPLKRTLTPMFPSV